MAGLVEIVRVSKCGATVSRQAFVIALGLSAIA